MTTGVGARSDSTFNLAFIYFSSYPEYGLQRFLCRHVLTPPDDSTRRMLAATYPHVNEGPMLAPAPG